MKTLRDLRRAAVARTFFLPADLGSALLRLGFVQADPIRAPARAQDLILRHRVVDYRAGDLERAYPTLPLAEEILHVYGFLHRTHRALLYPRRVERTFHVEDEHPLLARAILRHLRREGASHPREIEDALARRHPRTGIVNAWGGTSIATTRMLEVLHYRGLLSIVRRDAGVRVYAIAPRIPAGETLSPHRRADGLIELLLGLYAPMPMASLMQLLWMLGDRALPLDRLRARVPLLLRRGRLETAVVDGVAYVWLSDAPPIAVDDTPTVRFLAPFDPLVWDRRRFDRLWGWEYRFEAYVPAPKRRLGYYAMPILWSADGDPQVIGWINVKDGVEPGYVRSPPRDRAYRQAFDAEVARLERFRTPT